MTLQDEVNERRQEIRTDGYRMSIGEWVSLYENSELDIHPEFQRFFRWTDQQKSTFIESLLLGIPIPPIFVSQREDGVWDVIDGLQRLSTIFQFMGILRDENGKPVPPLKLSGTRYLPSLQDAVWIEEGDDSQDGNTPLPVDLQLLIKRTPITVSIILRESDRMAKYDLFQRLNTGGSQLSDQEVRNCIMVMLNADFYRWITDLIDNDDFRNCLSLSDRPLSEAYDVELALRFVIFSLINEGGLNRIGDVGVFLTDKMSEICISEEFDRAFWNDLFGRTFAVLNEQMGDRVFKRYDLSKDRFMGGFLISPYEAIAFGVAFAINNNQPLDDIEKRVKHLWSMRDFTDWIGSGITAARRLPRIIPIGRRVFSDAGSN